jgi:hypothetical protein
MLPGNRPRQAPERVDVNQPTLQGAGYRTSCRTHPLPIGRQVNTKSAHQALQNNSSATQRCRKNTKTLAGQCHQPNTLGRAQHQVTTQVKHRVSKTAPPASNQVEPQQGHHCITEWLRSPNPAGRSECKMHGAPMRESNASANQQAGKRQRPAGAAKMASKNTCMVHNEPFLSIVTQSNATNSS